MYSDAMTKALIVGGGIAGTVTAIALHQAGIEAVVNEAYGRAADGVGAYLTLAVNGLDALRCLDLDTAASKSSFDTPNMALYLGSGRKLVEFPLGGALPDGTVCQTIKRADLYLALREEAVRRGVEIRFGKRLIGAENTGDGVVARFDDGSSDTGDLLIGADGLRSRTRDIIDPAAPPARYVPLLNTGGYARGITVDAKPGTINMVFGKRAFFGYFPHPDGEVWWFANPPRRKEPTSSELAAITPAQWRGEVTGLFTRDNTPAVDIINASEEVFPGWATHDFPTVPTWHRGRMVVIGDAAHAVSPASGQGASMAMEDAVVLAKCLRDIADVPTAFRAYERLRRARVERIVAQGKKNGDDKIVGPVGRVTRDLILTQVMKKAASTGEDPLRWMWDHHIAWDVPIQA
jgi:FAD-dependent urate hydroxylase